MGESGNHTDELTMYLLSRICNIHLAVICKDCVYYSHTIPPEDSEPRDCDIMFVYLGNNNFREVKMCSSSNTHCVKDKSNKLGVDIEWKPKGK